MRRSPIRLRTFLLGTVLVLLLVSTLGGGAAWLIEHQIQQTSIDRQLNTAATYVTSHRADMQQPSTIASFARLLDRLGVLARLTLATGHPSEKGQLYLSRALLQQQPRSVAAPQSDNGHVVTPGNANAGWPHERRLVPTTTAGSRALLTVDLYHRPSSQTTRALVALLSGTLLLVGGLVVAAWLVGRWMVAPLTRLSAQVDKVAGGELAIAVPRSRISEITNIAQAVDGMTAALGDTEQQRAEADESKRFLVTSIAHDLRTPLFALRGHLQAIGSRLGTPAVHLERAEARADALERLVGNLFAYTRDDYPQPGLLLETVPIADLLRNVAAGLEQAARLRGNTFDLDGDETINVIVDRERFKRALTNILDNTVRYSPTGAPIHLAWIAPGSDTVEITVRDHGPGIEPALLPRIFDPGVRGTPEHSCGDQGAGLGLTIAKRLLEHQNATVAAHNRPDEGAEIHITLQRALCPDPTSQPRSAARFAAEAPIADAPADEVRDNYVRQFENALATPRPLAKLSDRGDTLTPEPTPERSPDQDDEEGRSSTTDMGNLYAVANRARVLWHADLRMEPTTHPRIARTQEQWIQLAEAEIGVKLTPRERKLCSQIAFPEGAGEPTLDED